MACWESPGVEGGGTSRQDAGASRAERAASHMDGVVRLVAAEVNRDDPVASRDRLDSVAVGWQLCWPSIARPSTFPRNDIADAASF